MRPRVALASRFLLVALVLALPVVLTGCARQEGDGGKEADLISESPKKAAELPKGSGPLLPLDTGRSWKTITIRPQQKNVDSEIRVVGSYRVPDGRTGTLVRSYRGGKPYRVEVFQSGSDGALNLLALGESEEKLLVFTPPVPFLGGKAKEGQYFAWTGSARLGKQSYTATAFHRLSAIEPVETPFETIRAYRNDGIISLANGAQRIDYPVVMWLVPGKGVAQRRLADRGTLALEITTKLPK